MIGLLVGAGATVAGRDLIHSAGAGSLVLLQALLRSKSGFTMAELGAALLGALCARRMRHAWAVLSSGARIRWRSGGTTQRPWC